MKSILVFLLLAPTYAALAQEQGCSNEYVMQLMEKQHNAHVAWRNEVLTQNRSAVAQKHSSEQGAAAGEMLACAIAGNVRAMYLAGKNYETDGTSTVDIANMDVLKNSNPKDAAQIKDIGEGQLKEAATWYRRAADKGEVNAMYSLGQMYAEGKGVAKSTFVAIDWLYRAGIWGVENNAREFALRNLEKMTEIAPKNPLTVELSNRIYKTESNISKKKSKSN